MVDNLAERIDECPLNQGCYVLLCTIGSEKCSLYGVAGCPLFRVSNVLKSMEKWVGTFSPLYRGLSTVEGCPLIGVPL